MELYIIPVYGIIVSVLAIFSGQDLLKIKC